MSKNPKKVDRRRRALERLEAKLERINNGHQHNAVTGQDWKQDRAQVEAEIANLKRNLGEVAV